LIGYRNRLLADNDATDYRRTTIMPGFGPAAAVVTETRAPIDRDGVITVRGLSRYREKRFGNATVKLAARLRKDLGWPTEGEIDGYQELERVRLRSLPDRSQATPCDTPETA
jgi:hypothetical protein